MMKAKYCILFLSLLTGILLYNLADAQSIRGDTIYLEVNKVVRVDFISSPNKAELLPTNDGQEGVYIVDIMGKNSISVHALKKGKDQDLEVSEKDRKHLFILSYKEGSTARTEDLSTKKRLSQRITEVKKNVARALNETDSLYDQATNNKTDAVLWTGVETKYQRLLPFVEGSDADYVKSRLEESRKQVREVKDMKYGEAIKAGQDYSSAKKYSDARKAYVKALEYKPEDAQALKYIDLTDAAWVKEYVDLGDEAGKAKKWVLAKTYYQEARNIKPDYPSLQDKFNLAKKAADPLIYTTEKEKGDQAMKADDAEEARRAYDSALSVKPDDKYVKNQLKILIAEEQKIEQEQKNDAEYQGILAAAKRLAEKAVSAQDYSLAIKEYDRAANLIPERKFPRKMIAELTKKKQRAKPD